MKYNMHQSYKNKYGLTNTNFSNRRLTMKEKKQSALSRLMGIAGGPKYFTYASCVLAILAAWIALIPFYDIYHCT